MLRNGALVTSAGLELRFTLTSGAILMGVGMLEADWAPLPEPLVSFCAVLLLGP